MAAKDLQIVDPNKIDSKKLTIRMAEKYGVEQSMLLETLKATAFKVKNAEVSNAQMVALLVVADQYGLNPFTKEIYAFPDKNGIVPVVGVDGWNRIINGNENFDGMEFRYSESEEVSKGLNDAKPCPDWIEVVIYRKDRKMPTIVREYLDECYQPPRSGYAGPWQSHTKRMLRHKTLIQGGRVAFGFGGIYDEDEASRIVDLGNADVIESTQTGKPIVQMPTEKSQKQAKEPQTQAEAPKDTVKAEEEAPASSKKVLTKQAFAIETGKILVKLGEYGLKPAQIQATLIKGGFSADLAAATPSQQTPILEALYGAMGEVWDA